MKKSKADKKHAKWLKQVALKKQEKKEADLLAMMLGEEPESKRITGWEHFDRLYQAPPDKTRGGKTKQGKVKYPIRKKL